MMPTVEAKLARAEARVATLRRGIVFLAAVVVFFGIIAPVAVIRVQQSTATRVACVSARANISQLQALSALEHRLGIPVDFKIPVVPPECDGV